MFSPGETSWQYRTFDILRLLAKGVPGRSGTDRG